MFQSAAASPATNAVQARHQSQPSALSATHATRNQGGNRDWHRRPQDAITPPRKTPSWKHDKILVWFSTCRLKGQSEIFWNWRWTLVFSIRAGFSNRGKGLFETTSNGEISTYQTQHESQMDTNGWRLYLKGCMLKYRFKARKSNYKTLWLPLAHSFHRDLLPSPWPPTNGHHLQNGLVKSGQCSGASSTCGKWHNNTYVDTDGVCSGKTFK